MSTSPALCFPPPPAAAAPPWTPSPDLLRQYPFLLHLTSCNSMRHLRHIHAHAITSGAARDNFVASRLLAFAALSPTGSLPYALLLFSRLHHSDAFLYNTLIRALAPVDALRFYADRIESSPNLSFPDSHTFPLLLKACSKIQSLTAGKTVHSHAIKLGLASQVPVQNFLIHMYASCGSVSSARLVFEGIEEFDDASLNIMISGYLKCWCLDSARQLFDKLGKRDVVSWSVMISWYVQKSFFREGLELFREVLAEKLEPNESALVSVLSACAHLGAVEQGEWVEGYLQKNSVKLTVRLGTALIDMYLKCGFVEKAFGVFDLMEEKNVTTWSAMISGLAINGHAKDALRLFSEMEMHGVSPNDVSFIGVLNACSHSRMVDEGLKYFESMEEYGVTPNVHHYCCLVDLYGRAGRLSKAEEVIETMPMKPNSAVWGALLNSCRIHGNAMLGEQVGKKLLELDPSNSGRYVLLSNIYAANGRWDDAAELRRLMKERGVTKTPGSSFIDLNGSIHEFIAGDNFHPQRKEIYRKLDEMSRKLKLEGYQPSIDDVLIDMDEEEKETALCHHSEKLALALGLINSYPGTTIRITKNLRVCGDCHSVTKLISKIYDRNIVVRDRSRFHHFRDGSCSCMDFW